MSEVQTFSAATLRPAIFLDRDGVLVENVYYPDSGLWEAPRTPDRCSIYPWTAQALRLLHDAGYALIVISNQPNVALGKSTALELEEVHRAMVCSLEERGVSLTASYYCYHHPRALEDSLRVCDCRKPSPRLVRDAASAHAVDLRLSWMIGDRSTDIECGQRAGLRTVQVAPDHPAGADNGPSPLPEMRAANLLEAVQLILRQEASERASKCGT